MRETYVQKIPLHQAARHHRLRGGLPGDDIPAIRAQNPDHENPRGGRHRQAGTNAQGVIKAAEQLGFSAKGVKGDKAAFFSKFPLPATAHVVVGGTLLHYMVIHKIGKRKVIVADPAKGMAKYSSITEKAIERTISVNTEGVTTFIIAHRLPTVMRCDRICVMEGGCFAEVGSHRELVAKKGIYVQPVP
jgi:ABC-type bacteriocin/lantibiotic exporter with double-glycine peptidase domain